MRRSLLLPFLIALSLACALVLPASALAWKADGDLWPGTVVRYHAKPMTAGARGEALEAVKAWNLAGARIRLVPATRRAAQLVIQAPDSRGTCSGYSRSSFAQGRRTSSSITWSLCGDRPTEVRIIAHEIGHSLGLAHEPRTCGVMGTPLSNGVPITCNDVKRLPRGQRYCAVLEPDDVRGLVARYGGTVRIPTRRICTNGPRPAPVTALAATIEPPTETSQVQLAWANPPKPAATVRIVVTKDRCPTGLDELDPTYLRDVVATPLQPARWDIAGLGVGGWCALVLPLDAFGQPGPARTVRVTIPPPPPAPPTPGG